MRQLYFRHVGLALFRASGHGELGTLPRPDGVADAVAVRAFVCEAWAADWAGASLYQGGTLAYLTARPLDDDTNELGITAHGPGSAGLAATALTLLRDWDR